MVAYIVRTGILHDRFRKFKLVCLIEIIRSDSRDTQAEIHYVNRSIRNGCMPRKSGSRKSVDRFSRIIQRTKRRFDINVLRFPVYLD